MKRNNRLFAVISSIILGLYSLVLLSLLIWAFISSFKSDLDFTYHPIGLPLEKFGGWHFKNFLTAYETMTATYIHQKTGNIVYVYAGEMLMNSLIYTIGCTIVSVFVTSLVAYCCSRFRYKICEIIYYTVVVVITLPIVGALPSEVQMSRNLGIYDTFFGMFFMKSYFANMNFLIFYAMFKNIPMTYSEAAKIDGAGQWTIFFKVILPMAKATTLGVFLLLLIQFWNDYTVPMLYLPSHPVIAYGLYIFQNSRSEFATEPVKLAASFLVGLPVLILFIIFRDKLMSNISMGGLKG